MWGDINVLKLPIKLKTNYCEFTVLKQMKWYIVKMNAV